MKATSQRYHKGRAIQGVWEGALAALSLALGGAIAAAILAAASDNDFNFGGDVVVISPSR